MYEIVISNEENIKKIMLVENKKLVEYYEEDSNKKRLEGNIYLGKIRNIVPGMQAAFVDIGVGKNTFIQVKDLIPKLDETKGEKQDIKEIQEIAKIGMNVVVQIKKDATSKKGARVSTHINLPGKYLAYMPNVNFITVSQKIENNEEKDKLKKILSKIIPEGSGAIIRTSALYASEEEISVEAKKLISEWNQIHKKAKNSNEIQLLYKADNIISKIIKDTISNQISRIVVDNDEDYNEVKDILKDLNIKRKIAIEKKEKSIEVYELYKQIDKNFARKIWLKCGGFITIDKTEALTAIDVNSGKYTGDVNQEQTIYTVNKEATEEIAKQLRLRDIGGIIIVDYIDMHNEENKQRIIDFFKECIKKDRSKTQILEFTRLNLLELTRKHMFSN
ncbi:MAG: Rne/Rng family ribonuclease [Clostridia bacterium]|nr:Rne/Rng family ribonuclease [Clostridia bacterium]